MQWSVTISILSHQIGEWVLDESFYCLGRGVDCCQVHRRLLVVILLVDHLLHCSLKITQTTEKDVEARKTVLGGEVEKVLLVHENPSRLDFRQLRVVNLCTTGDHREKKIAVVVLVMPVEERLLKNMRS